MRAAAIAGPGRVITVDRPVPHARGDLVVVQILVAPMCTEFRDRQRGGLSDSLGHEAAGIVVDAGSSTRVSIGERVVVMPQYGCGTCRYCTSGEHIYCPFQRDALKESESSYGVATFAEYVVKPDWLLLPVPADVSMRHAALTCCALGPTFTAHVRSHTQATDTVVVSGCGPVGLGGILHGVSRGSRVIALETEPYRQRLAAKLGAVLVLDPRDAELGERVRSETGGWGADVGIETSGASSAPADLAGLLRRRGRLALVAWGQDVALPPLVPLGLDVAGCWHWNHQRYAAQMWHTVRRGAERLDNLVTHQFDLSDVSDAMDVQDSRECGKVLLFPHGRDAAE